MHHTTEFQISQLRFKSLLMMVESLAVFVAALFVSALLPSLLFRYLYANQQLVEQPKALELIPVVAFVIGVGYFIAAAVTSVTREMQVMKLQKDLNNMECDCDCGCCQTDSRMGVSSAAHAEGARKVGRPKKVSR